jgi:hypothetical protein
LLLKKWNLCLSYFILLCYDVITVIMTYNNIKNRTLSNILNNQNESQARLFL